MDLPMKYREWFWEKKNSRFFIQIFSSSLPSWFYINFVLVCDVLYGLISRHSMVIYGANVSAIINKSVKDV